MSPELKSLLDTLNSQYGQAETSRIHRTEYIAVHKTMRKEVIFRMVKTMQKRGKDKSYFVPKSVQDDIASFFFPNASTEGYTKQKRDGAMAVVYRELSEVLAKVWPDEDIYTDPIEPEEKPKPKKDNSKNEEPRKYGKKVDESIYKDLPKSKPVYDKEFAKLIGIKTDE